MTMDAVRRYTALLDELLARRAKVKRIGEMLGASRTLDDDTEERLVTAMHDCRADMSPAEEATLDSIVDERTRAQLPEPAP